MFIELVNDTYQVPDMAQVPANIMKTTKFGDKVSETSERLSDFPDVPS